MAWSEFDGLSDEALLSAIYDLRTTILQIDALEKEVDEDGNSYTLSLSENYEALDLAERLGVLLLEANHRRVIVPVYVPDSEVK